MIYDKRLIAVLNKHVIHQICDVPARFIDGFTEELDGTFRLIYQMEGSVAFNIVKIDSDVFTVPVSSLDNDINLLTYDKETCTIYLKDVGNAILDDV